MWQRYYSDPLPRKVPRIVCLTTTSQFSKQILKFKTTFFIIHSYLPNAIIHVAIYTVTSILESKYNYLLQEYAKEFREFLSGAADESNN